MNRKDLYTELNKVNKRYHDTKLNLEKLPNSISNIGKLNRIYRDHMLTLKSKYVDGLSELNDGKAIRIK